MIELMDLRQTLDSIASCNDDGEVWERYGWVHATDGGALTAHFWLPASEEEAFDEDALPAAARALGLSSFLEPASFADVLEVQKRQRPLSSLQDYAQALDYYAEYDAFLQVPGIDEALGEAPAAAQAAAREAGVGPGIFNSFDVVLAACPPPQLKDAARQVALHLSLSIAEAHARCQRLPLCLGEQVDGRRAAALVTAFAAAGIPLQVRGFGPFPWSAEPSVQ